MLLKKIKKLKIKANKKLLNKKQNKKNTLGAKLFVLHSLDILTSFNSRSSLSSSFVSFVLPLLHSSVRSDDLSGLHPLFPALPVVVGGLWFSYLLEERTKTKRKGKLAKVHIFQT